MTSRASESAQTTNDEPGFKGAAKSVHSETERTARGAGADAAVTGAARRSDPPTRMGSTLVSVAPPVTEGAESNRYTPCHLSPGRMSIVSVLFGTSVTVLLTIPLVSVEIRHVPFSVAPAESRISTQ